MNSNMIRVSTDGFQCVDDAYVFGLENAVEGSKYPMLVDIAKANADLTDTVDRLATSELGHGHDQFLTGIVVQLDLTLSIKAWVEAERYHFLDFISSQSTMHRIAKMDIRKQCNGYVTESTLKEVERLKEQYLKEPTIESYLVLLYNVPVGFMLTAKMTTNYRQLKTIYQQRKNHRLPEWRELCNWLETLPCSHFITGVGR